MLYKMRRTQMQNSTEHQKRDVKEATHKPNSSIYPFIWKCDFLHFVLIHILNQEEQHVITGKTKSTEHIFYPFIWKCDLFHSY